jgi:hypothetical protein
VVRLVRFEGWKYHESQRTACLEYGTVARMLWQHRPRTFASWRLTDSGTS